jgi:hypothetical protein
MRRAGDEDHFKDAEIVTESREHRDAQGRGRAAGLRPGVVSAPDLSSSC